jgi:hypothetical protein
MGILDVVKQYAVATRTVRDHTVAARYRYSVNQTRITKLEEMDAFMHSDSPGKLKVVEASLEKMRALWRDYQQGNKPYLPQEEHEVLRIIRNLQMMRDAISANSPNVFQPKIRAAKQQGEKIMNDNTHSVDLLTVKPNTPHPEVLAKAKSQAMLINPKQFNDVAAAIASAFMSRQPLHEEAVKHIIAKQLGYIDWYRFEQTPEYNGLGFGDLPTHKLNKGF